MGLPPILQVPLALRAAVSVPASVGLDELDGDGATGSVAVGAACALAALGETLAAATR